MAKVQSKVMYVCQQCGSESPKWQGRCPDCGEWNSFNEVVISDTRGGASRAGTMLRSDGSARPQQLAEISADGFPRLVVPGNEFNRVLGGGIVPGSLVLISGDPGIGKCVTGDTRVLDPLSGAFLPITEWSRMPRRVLAVDRETLRLDPAAVTAFHERGKRAVVELTTRLGRKLRCTPDHPILTVDGWRAVEQLAPGTRIATPRALPYFGAAPLPEATIKLLAYMLSDGSAQSSINVTNCLPEVERDLEEIAAAFHMRLVRYPKPGNRATDYRFTNDVSQRLPARREFANALRQVKQQSGMSWQRWARTANVNGAMIYFWHRGQTVPSAQDLRSLAVAAGVPSADLHPAARELAEMKTPIARLLEEMGLRFARAADKAVPQPVFMLPREQVALFLKVLFTCDGSVYVTGHGTPGVSYSTISRRLAEDVQHLLLRFGFVATLRTKPSLVNGRSYTAYELALLGVAEVKRFLADIGIMGRANAISLIDAMPAPDGPSTRRDTIPTGPLFWQDLRVALGDSTFAEATRRAGTKIKQRRVDRPLCRETVQRVVDAFPSPYLHALAYGDVYWDEVVSVAPAGEEQVYDLTVPGRANFVANDLIIHNSTLLLQISAAAATDERKVLYVSAEESVQQIKLRAQRLGMNPANLFLLGEDDINAILLHIEQMKPGLVVVDSIQTVFVPEVSSAAGSVTQVRESTARLMHVAKKSHVPIFIVGHVTKDGNIAGPRVLEHMVDAVLYLEGDSFHQYRLLRGVKNRFGSTNEVGVFEMAAEGMIEVPNPSAVFLAERSAGVPGSAVAVTMEGSRPLLVELQALTTTSAAAMPRRTANGIDQNRLHLLIAVLTKRLGMSLYNQDVYVNVVGGLKIEEPAVDLAVAMAIASSFRNVEVDPELALIGEIGLSGELRSVGQLEWRLNEAAKLGFKRAIYPKAPGREPKLPADFQARGVQSLQDAIEAALTA